MSLSHAEGTKRRAGLRQAQPERWQWTSPSTAPAFLPLPLGEGRGEGSPGPSEAMARIVSPIPSVRAEKRSGRGARGQRSMPTLRDLTGRSCLSGAAQQQSEFCGRTPHASIAGCPAAKRRGHGQWGALLLLSFLVRARKEGRPPGRVPASQPQPSAMPAKQVTSKFIATHAQQTSANPPYRT